MEDLLPTIFVLLIIGVVVRWLTKSKATDGGLPGVTPSMVQTVHGAFPHIPPRDILWSLSKTRSAQATSEEILERGFLPTAPASFAPPPALLPPDVDTPAGAATAAAAGSPAKKPAKPPQSLIDKYGLSSRLPSTKGKERAVEEVPSTTTTTTTTQAAPLSASGRADGKWEDTREKRERELRERKERMILEARRRLLEKQAQATPAPEVPS